MKGVKKLLGALAMALPLFVTGCDDNDTPANLYQEYEVLVENGNASAFANMRVGGAGGERVKVGDESLTVNMLPMYYQTPVSATDPEYTYFATLATNHTKAVFRFKNSKGKTLVNTSEYSTYPTVSVKDNPYEVNPGQRLELTYGNGSVENVEAWVVGTSAVSQPSALTVMESIDGSTAYVTLPQVNGLYDLVLDYVVEAPVTDGDGSASGVIKTILRTRRTLKIGVVADS